MSVSGRPTTGSACSPPSRSSWGGRRHRHLHRPRCDRRLRLAQRARLRRGRCRLTCARADVRAAGAPDSALGWPIRLRRRRLRAVRRIPRRLDLLDPGVDRACHDPRRRRRLRRGAVRARVGSAGDVRRGRRGALASGAQQPRRHPVGGCGGRRHDGLEDHCPGDRRRCRVARVPRRPRGAGARARRLVDRAARRIRPAALLVPGHGGRRRGHQPRARSRAQCAASDHRRRGGRGGPLPGGHAGGAGHGAAGAARRIRRPVRRRRTGDLRRRVGGQGDRRGGPDLGARLAQRLQPGQLRDGGGRRARRPLPAAAAPPRTRTARCPHCCSTRSSPPH